MPTVYLMKMPPRPPVIRVIDYGMGNLRSVINALSYVGADARLTESPDQLLTADAVVLPGVGAFGKAVENLDALKIIPALNRAILELKKPFLGICLGMQLIAEESDEFGNHQGLGWVPGRVVRLKERDQLRVPHVGWNTIQPAPSSRLLSNLGPDPAVYFVHSYHFEAPDEYMAARCQYGVSFAAAIEHGNIYSVQFHPEKSQLIGLRILSNFVNLIHSQQ